jgi:hypothetical protein
LLRPLVLGMKGCLYHDHDTFAYRLGKIQESCARGRSPPVGGSPRPRVCSGMQPGRMLVHAAVLALVRSCAHGWGHPLLPALHGLSGPFCRRSDYEVLVAGQRGHPCLCPRSTFPPWSCAAVRTRTRICLRMEVGLLAYHGGTTVSEVLGWGKSWMLRSCMCGKNVIPRQQETQKDSRPFAASPSEIKRCERQDLNLHGFHHWILNPS